MRPILFKCTNTGMQVQALIPETDDTEPAGRQFHAVECTACHRIHLINLATNKLFGET